MFKDFIEKMNITSDATRFSHAEINGKHCFCISFTFNVPAQELVDKGLAEVDSDSYDEVVEEPDGSMSGGYWDPNINEDNVAEYYAEKLDEDRFEEDDDPFIYYTGDSSADCSNIEVEVDSQPDTYDEPGYWDEDWSGSASIEANWYYIKK